MNYNTNINWDLFFEKVDLYHNDKPILLKNFIPNPEELLSWKDVESLLNGYESHWEILKNQEKLLIPTKKSYWMPEGGYADKQFLKNSIEEGKTFIISNYSIHKPYTRAICQEIESRFKVITDMHVYGSKGNSSTSFMHHYDNPCNFIIQTYGKCLWKVYDNQVSLLLHNHQEETFNAINPQKLNLIIEDELSPGDMIYLPSRLIHVALPNQPRLSVSIPCYPGTEGRWDKNYYKI